MDFPSGGLRVTSLGPDLLCISIAAPGAEDAVGAGRCSALTASERAVVELVERGCSNRQIAELRGASARTVANQLTMAYKKLGVTSRRELRALRRARSD